jgi:TonB family protein
MTNKRLGSCVLRILAMLMPLTSHADLYTADDAHERKEFERAIELYREVAELGRPEAQESLAAMYVNGEGVKRDNVLGYAWASLALENGGGEAAKEIVRQLEPHLNAAARARIAEVHAKFGKAALQERLLPEPYGAGAPVDAKSCGMRSVVDPNAFYPVVEQRQGISGTVLVEVTVAPDGHARTTRVWYAVPAEAFGEAGRRVAFANSYTPPKENGVAVACTVRFRVKFSSLSEGGRTSTATPEEKKAFAEIRTQAEAGDPRSQLKYALLLEIRPDLNVPPAPLVDWMLKAAQAGVPAAQYLMGAHLVSSSREQSQGKGVLWLQMAADAGESDAQAALANYLMRTNTAEGFAKAQDLLEKAAASGHRDGKFLLAAVLAAGPDASRRDPKRSLELLTQVKNDLDFDPTFFEIRAAAYAMLGDFAEAQASQKRALQRARRLGWDLTDPQGRLSNYAESKPWVGNFFAY